MKYTDEQKSIIEALVEDDLLVIAGAGSGKTMTMTNRIVSLIQRGVPQESILGLTFTKKAASELLSRVAAAVAAQGQEGGWDPNSAFLKPEVQTYDAFFQAIVGQYGLLVGMDQGTQPLTDAGAFQLAAQVVQEHLDVVFANHVDDVADEGQAQPPLSPNEDESESGAFNTLVRDVLALSQACSTAMISKDCPTFEDAISRIRSWDAAFLDRVNTLVGSEAIPAKCPSTTAMSLPKKPGKSSRLTIEDKLGQMRQERHSFRLCQADSLRRTVRRRERLLTLVQYYQEAKRAAGVAEFSDFTLAAFQLVTRFPSIGAIYRRRFSHVFLDEYQDTSTTQALLLAALFHSEPTGEVFEERLSGKQCSAVSAVGDPFQSIYAWRGASPGAFKTFQREFGTEPHTDTAFLHTYGQSGKDPLTLSQTFRNSRIVLEAANLLTAPLRGRSVDGQPKTSAQLEEVEVGELSPRSDADAGTLGLLGYKTLGQEVNGVVRFVRSAVSMYGQADEQGLDKGAPHVAVLFRSKTSMPDYQQALEESGLRVQVIGYSALFDRPEIMDLLALLRLVCDHTDSYSLLRLLASPRFNLTPGDLSALSDLASQLNIESQYQALVQAGIAPAGLQAGNMYEQVRKHRDQLHTGVFLVDMLMQDDFPELMASPKAQRISPQGRSLLIKASRVFSQAQSQASSPLRQAVLAAVRALDLDLDLVVAQSLKESDDHIDASAARASLSAFFEQVDAYVQELPQGVNASLAGFVSWIDAMSTSPEEPIAAIDTHADVVLMTIHQAKGLEWDAVAVVGMKKDNFPSNQGDNLSILAQGDWDTDSLPMSYESTAKTWLEDSTAVPVPVRADSQILPRFPHQASRKQSTEEALAGLTLTSLEDEAYGILRSRTGFVDDTAASCNPETGEVVLAEDAIPDYLSQPQEYGRRLHNDERRLAYVALTRARHDLLVTFSAQTSNLDPALLDGTEAMPENALTASSETDVYQVIANSASNFWRELEVGFAGRTECVMSGSAWLNSHEEDADPQRLIPRGYFIGQRAAEYEQSVVSDALQQAPEMELTGGEMTGIWPVQLGNRIQTALAESARHVAEVDVKEYSKKSLNGNSLYAHARTLLRAGSGRLGVQGDVLVHDTEVLKQVGARVVSHNAQSVTAVQARSGALGEPAERRYWLSVVRPIPQVPSPLAQAGTAFHAWAADFLLPELENTAGLIAALPNGDLGMSSGDRNSSSLAARAALVEQLEVEKHKLDELGTDTLDAREQGAIGRKKMLLEWEQRLSQSQWADREPVWVERPIVAVVAGQVVKGKLDAVFAGGLNLSDNTKRYTIVDWKTGHKPLLSDERESKLAQLDLYRLLLSRKENIALDSIDACLYYVSVEDSTQRLIVARTKSEQDIEIEILAGLPEQSDND